MPFFEGEGGGGGGGDIQAKLREAEEGKRRAEEELTRKREAEEKLRREAEEKDLLDKKSYDELKRRAEAERQRMEQERERGAVQLALEIQAARAGLKKSEYLALVDKSGITYKDGVVEGADKAFEAFKKGHAELFTEGESKPGPSGGSDRAPKGGESSSSLVDNLLKEADKQRKPRYPRGWTKD